MGLKKIIYHPGTGTIIDVEECVVVSTDSLPINHDEWEEYLATTSVPCVELAVALKPRSNMMTRIDTDLFVGWDTCAKCGNYMTSCRCLGGPKEPSHISEWRKQRHTPEEPPLTREELAGQEADVVEADAADEPEALSVEEA